MRTQWFKKLAILPLFMVFASCTTTNEETSVVADTPVEQTEIAQIPDDPDPAICHMGCQR